MSDDTLNTITAATGPDLLVPLSAFDEGAPPGLHGSALTGPAPMRCMIVEHDTDESMVLLLAPETVERVPTEEVFVDLSAPPTPDAWVDALPWALGVLGARWGLPGDGPHVYRLRQRVAVAPEWEVWRLGTPEHRLWTPRLAPWWPDVSGMPEEAACRVLVAAALHERVGLP